MNDLVVSYPDRQIVPGHGDGALPVPVCVSDVAADLVQLVGPERDVLAVLVEMDGRLASRADRHPQLLGLTVGRGPREGEPQRLVVKVQLGI